jgi:hypothetical protein
MEDRAAPDVHRQLALELDQASMCDVAAGHDVTGQVDHVADVEVGQVLVLDGRGEDSLVQSTTPVCETIS